MKSLPSQQLLLMAALTTYVTLHATTSVAPDALDAIHHEITFNNTTNHTIEIGYSHKPSRRSPSIFVSAGYIGPQESKNIAVRSNHPHIARYSDTKGTSASQVNFTPLLEDKQFKLSSQGNVLKIEKIS